MTALLSDADLADLREVAESAMPDECQIVRLPTGEDAHGDLDPVTLQYEPTDLEQAASVYVGICEVDHQAATTDDDTAGADQARAYVVVKIPVTATGASDVRRGDVVKLTDVVHNPALVGRVVVVEGFDDKSYSTKRRLYCREGV